MHGGHHCRHHGKAKPCHEAAGNVHTYNALQALQGPCRQRSPPQEIFMNQPFDTSGRFGTVASQGAQRNKVLSNTYRLLALSMIPMVEGMILAAMARRRINWGWSFPAKAFFSLGP